MAYCCWLVAHGINSSNNTCLSACMYATYMYTYMYVLYLKLCCHGDEIYFICATGDHDVYHINRTTEMQNNINTKYVCQFFIRTFPVLFCFSYIYFYFSLILLLLVLQHYNLVDKKVSKINFRLLGIYIVLHLLFTIA